MSFNQIESAFLYTAMGALEAQQISIGEDGEMVLGRRRFMQIGDDGWSYLTVARKDGIEYVPDHRFIPVKFYPNNSRLPGESTVQMFFRHEVEVGEHASPETLMRMGLNSCPLCD